MSKLTVKAKEVANFATSDERLTRGGWELALVGGEHRDSRCLDVANAEEIASILNKVDPNHENHDYLQARHWAVGWYRHLVVNPESPAVMAVLKEIKDRLDNYPILCEDRLSNLEGEWHFDGRCDDDCTYCQGEGHHKFCSECGGGVAHCGGQHP